MEETEDGRGPLRNDYSNAVAAKFYQRAVCELVVSYFPGAALVGSAEAVAARAHVLPVNVAVAVGRDALAEATHAADGLGRADDEVLVAIRGVDALDNGLGAVSVELALREGVVVVGVDDVDGDAAGGIGDGAVGGDGEFIRGRAAVEGEVGDLDGLGAGLEGWVGQSTGEEEAEGDED
jgi:hypothetical protein